MYPKFTNNYIFLCLDASVPRTSFKPQGVKRLKHLKTKEEKHNSWNAVLNRLKQRDLKNAHDFELRCRREIELKDERTSELREKRHDEEIQYLTLAERIQLIDQGCEESKDDLSFVDFVR